MHSLMTFIADWWAAFIAIPWILVSLVEGVRCVRARDYDRATQWFIFAEVIWPTLIILATPARKVFPLPWTATVMILCYTLGFVTVYLYGRHHRRGGSL